MSIDKQGCGDELDESRIERNNQRPLENNLGEDNPPPKKSKIDNTIRKTKGDVNQILSGENTMDSHSFQHQTQLLNELKNFLGQFQERLEGVSNSYQNKVNHLRENGMMKETYERFTENQLEPTCNLIKKLIEHIEHNDIPAVEKAMRDIEPLL